MQNSNHDDDHDRGLAFDLSTLMGRRQLLGLFGTASAGLALSACLPGPAGSSEPNVMATGAAGQSCIKTPVETQGPFPADGSNRKSGSIANVLKQSGVVRQDIRSSFGSLTGVAQGVQSDIAITLVDIGDACKPLAGHVVYIWHCDAEGRYSIYDLEGAYYLRGVGVTDENGQVRFTTVFPGCYAGRWPHIHFEVFESAQKAATSDDSILISQFALPEATCLSVYEANPVYAASVTNLAKSPLSSDGIFRDNTPEQLAAQTLVMSGDVAGRLAGAVTVGIKRS